MDWIWSVRGKGDNESSKDFYLSNFEDAIAVNQDGESCLHNRFRAEISELSFGHPEFGITLKHQVEM